MARPVILSAEVNGETHTVTAVKKSVSYAVGVDGSEYAAFRLGKKSVLGAHEDFPIRIDGEDYILAVRFSRIRLVKDGKYIDNGDDFLSAAPVPTWYWVFFALNIAIVVGGGGLSAALAAAGASICANIARSNRATGMRFRLCAAVTLIAWVALFLLYAISSWK